MVSDQLKSTLLNDEHLLSLQQTLASLEEIDSLVLDGLSYDELKSAFFDKLKTLPRLIRLAESFKIPLYRVSVDDRLDFDISDPKTFSHPPNEFCQIGRCNRKGYPVFYASMSQNAALHEKRKDKNSELRVGDEVYISTWKVEENYPFNYSQFIFGSVISVGEIVSELNENNLFQVQQLSKRFSKDKQLAFEHLLQKFGQYFLSDNYTLSSFLCHNLLYDGRENAPVVVDAIIYPSVQKNLNDFNVAIHPEFVQAHVRLEEVIKVRLTSIEEAGIHIQLIKSGVIGESGKIEWVPSSFGTTNMHLNILGISFKDLEPPLSQYSNDSHFMYGAENRSLESICWDYLNQNKTKLLAILFKDIKNDYKTQRKELFVNILGDLVSIQVDGSKYIINAVKVELDYEISLVEA